MSLNRDCTVYARNNGNVMHSIMRYFYVSHLLRLCIGTWNQIREIHTKIQYGLHLVQVILNEIDTQFYQSTQNTTTDYLVCVFTFGTTDIQKQGHSKFPQKSHPHSGPPRQPR